MNNANTKKTFNPKRRKALTSDIKPNAEDISDAMYTLVAVYNDFKSSEGSVFGKHVLSEKLQDELHRAILTIGDYIVYRYPEFKDRLNSTLKSMGLLHTGYSWKLYKYLKG